MSHYLHEWQQIIIDGVEPSLMDMFYKAARIHLNLIHSLENAIENLPLGIKRLSSHNGNSFDKKSIE